MRFPHTGQPPLSNTVHFPLPPDRFREIKSHWPGILKEARHPRPITEDHPMLGAIVGDIIGSAHEGAGTKTTDFPLFVPESRFTDDTVLTAAVASSLLTGRNYVDTFHDYFEAY